jgi:hypothetical protein
VTVDIFLETGGPGPVSPGMSLVANQEEEGLYEFGEGQPLAAIDEVHRVGFGDDAGAGILGTPGPGGIDVRGQVERLG